jgi:hypothetical protein
MAIDKPHEYISIMIDRMDTCATIPQLNIMGVITHGRGAYVFHTLTKWPSSAHLHIECLSRVFSEIGWDTLANKTIFLQLGSNAGENKNNKSCFLFAWLATLNQRRIIKEVNLCL